MKRTYRSWTLLSLGIGILILVLAWIVFAGLVFFFPDTIMLQSSTHFLHMTSNNPAAGASVEWCPKEPAPLTLRNGDTVLGYDCMRLGWLPFHAETPWPGPTAAPQIRLHR